jgi:hypothetical protein
VDRVITLYAQWEYYYSVGDTGPAGGVIFYVKDNNDGGWRYLEAAPADVEGSHEWGGLNFEPHISCSTGTDVGTGKENTEDLITHNHSNAAAYSSPTHDAARACAEYRGGGYADWFLPSKDELYEMWVYNTDDTYVDKRIPNLAGHHWSSSQDDYLIAWYLNFSNGEFSSNYKVNQYLVRPARRF